MARHLKRNFCAILNLAKQTGLAPILIVLLMAALAVGGYLIYSQQAKPTPPPQQTTQSAGKKQVAINPSDERLNFSIYITYYPVPDLSQADEVMQQVAGCDKANEQEISHAPKGKDFLIDNQKTILYEDSLCAQFTAANFYILQNDNIYSISVISTEKYSLHKDVAEEILSTFKFTN